MFHKNQITCGITGHSGTIGRNLIKSSKKIRFIYFKGNIINKKDVKNWIKENSFEYLIHLAAIVPIREVNKNKKKALLVNTKGTANLVEAILNNDNAIKWSFLASTSHVYSSSKKKIKENFSKKPISYYGKTKLLAEQNFIKLKKRKIKVCIGRIFSTANNSQRANYLVPDLKRRIKNAKKKIKLENLNHYRDFISIKDIVKILKYFMKNEIKGVYNISSSKKIRLTEIAKIISKHYKKVITFELNKNPTYLIGNNFRLRKIYKKKIDTKLKKIIFND